MGRKQPNPGPPRKKTFLEAMFYDLDRLDDGLTDEEVRQELEDAGINVEEAKKKFHALLDTLKKEATHF